MKFNIHLLIINFNYSKFLIKNQIKLKSISSHLKSFTIIDDQSTEDISSLKKIYTKNLIITKSCKSTYNYLNQLNAINFGIDNLTNILDDDYIWVVDADDIPVLPKNLSFDLNQDFDLLFFGRKEKDEIIFPKITHGFWVKNCYTSSIIFTYKLFKENKTKIYSEGFHDIWFDVRLCSLIFLNGIKFRICCKVNNERIIHGMNDSLRIKKYSIKRLLKILNTINFSKTL